MKTTRKDDFNKFKLKKNMTLETVKRIIESPDLNLSGPDYAIGIRYAVNLNRDWANYLASKIMQKIGDYPKRVKNGFAKLTFGKDVAIDETEYTQYWMKKYYRLINAEATEQCVQGFMFVEGWIIHPTGD